MHNILIFLLSFCIGYGERLILDIVIEYINGLSILVCVWLDIYMYNRT